MRTLLDTAGTPTVEQAVLLGAAQRLPARLRAVRVPEEVAAQRRRKTPNTSQLLLDPSLLCLA